MSSSKKYKFFVTQVKWCGTITNNEGYRLDPHNLEEIWCVKLPVTAYEL